MKKFKLSNLTKKTKKGFPNFFIFMMFIALIIFILVLIFSRTIELMAIAIFISAESVFYIIGLFLMIKNNYKKESEVEESNDDNIVLPKAYYSIVNSIDKIDKSTDTLIFEITLLPTLRNLISDKFRAKYSKNIQSTNYEKILDSKLIKIIKEKHPYHDGLFGYTKSIDIKSEVIDILNKIEAI